MMDKSKSQVPTVGRIIHVVIDQGTRPAIITEVERDGVSATIFMKNEDKAGGFIATADGKNTLVVENLQYSTGRELMTWYWPDKI